MAKATVKQKASTGADKTSKAKAAKAAKAPKKAAAAASGKTFKLTLDKSLIGCNYSQRETVRCLGLKKRQSTSVVADNPANRGQILKVQHLITVEVVR